MAFNDILIIGIMFVLPFAFLFIAFNTDKCSKGAQHSYKLIKEKYVRGNDIGFGITNSYTSVTYKCAKCGKIYDSIT